MIQWKENKKATRREVREDGTEYYPYHNLKEVLALNATWLSAIGVMLCLVI